MNAALQIPRLSNLWVQPIRNRIDMLSTGIKSPVGIKIAGPGLKVIEKLGLQVEGTVKQVPGTRSAYAERVQGGRYIEVRIDRVRAARFGLSLADVQQVVAPAIGGENVGETVEGLQRFPINMRYPRELRDSVEKLRVLPIVTQAGATTTLGAVADLVVTDGPPQIRSENARLNGWVYVDISGRDLGSYVGRNRQRAERRGQRECKPLSTGRSNIMPQCHGEFGRLGDMIHRNPTFSAHARHCPGSGRISIGGPRGVSMSCLQ
jgi:Cu(I)/Ag(I) efflux system membrane protein CusA/SilA